MQCVLYIGPRPPRMGIIMGGIDSLHRNINALVICMDDPPLPIHSGEMQGIPVQNMGTFRPIPVEYCPGGGNFPS